MIDFERTINGRGHFSPFLEVGINGRSIHYNHDYDVSSNIEIEEKCLKISGSNSYIYLNIKDISTIALDSGGIPMETYRFDNSGILLIGTKKEVK